ncbi:helix-turn-helix domain-containing protein [Actinoplanes lobatus]|uniref:XRE family transcriptional regulator n=1 Tax=Actinoplanes lobatus TaxID=113568 RepID=A0ABQ4AZK4_9ACTN|nr:helix-turn-helix transcriptional regulator [Actinoplanes lobatus]GIE46404.1 hypothetical protein Alo02nite_93020 [Actinoplanes lobatus]
MPHQELTPLGELLEHARSKVLHLSVRQAAKRAGVSPTLWTQVVTGRRAGSPRPVRTTVRTVVAMALAVNVDPGEALGIAGMPSAPEAIEAIVSELHAGIEAESQVASRNLADEIERIGTLHGVTADEKIRMVNTLINIHEQRAAESGTR